MTEIAELQKENDTLREFLRGKVSMLISRDPIGKLSTLDLEDEKLLDATMRQPCCIIPARGGSKRIKHKNKRLLNGRPLFDYALKAALDSDVFHLIIVSSDDEEILEYAYENYFKTEKMQPQRRPKPLCGDKSPIRVAIRYAIQSYEAPNTLCLLQPTNPLITPEQIKKAYEIYCEKKPNYLFGMCKGKDIGFHFFERNQFFTDFEKLWDVEYLPFEVDGIDIDTEEDWQGAERRLSRNG